MATYGSWLLMRDPRFNLYILNLFTYEGISLPPVESQLGMIKIERTVDDGFHVSPDHNGREFNSRGIPIRTPVFWIDEKTKDYVVIWGFGMWCVVYAKKGDTSWNQIPELSNCFDMVYKDHKLYFSSSGYECELRIFDLSREVPQQTFQGCVIMRLLLKQRRLKPYRTVNTKLVVTVNGDVLKVDKIWDRNTSICRFFDIWKAHSSGSFKMYEKVVTLGDEALLWDLGITVLANDTGLLKRNCIYFSGSHGKIINDKFIYDLETEKMDPVHKFDCSPAQLSSARWFLPNFTQT